MLWQYAHPADSPRSLYEDPRLAHAVVDFVPRLASMTQNLITGILVSQPSRSNRQDGKQDPKPKFPRSRLADAFDQVVEPLIMEIT